MTSSPTAAPFGSTGRLSRPRAVVSVGAELFADALAMQDVSVRRVAWRPPHPGMEQPLARVLADPRREEADGQAVRRMLASRPQLVDVRPAAEALGLRPGDFLHAGPPITWQRACGPLRGALIGAMLLEGLASTPEQASAALADGAGISLTPCHHQHAVGPMAGVVSPSMWVFELVDATHGTHAWCPLNEGLGRVLRWMAAVLGPVLSATLRRHGPLDITALLAQAVQMGDEGHNRNRAATSLLLRELLPDLLECGAPASTLAEVVRFIRDNDHFFLNLSMPACKLAADAARDLPGSSVVVAMARNGTDFGIQVSGTGDAWFTAPAEVPHGLYLGSYGPADANPDIGDSAITETAGLGGMALAAAPAIVRFVGGDVTQALTITTEMYEITLAEHPGYQIPGLGFRGTPTAIDITRVVRTGILPSIDTGIAGREPGTGQVGAGLVRPPAQVFTAALTVLAESAPPLL
jgi:Protein of unknown function (DUF1116)